MDLLRTASPTVSTSSSLDSNGLPHCRIQCDKRQILVGNQKYQSATDALVAYLNQFDLQDGGGGGQRSPGMVVIGGTSSSLLSNPGSAGDVGNSNSEAPAVAGAVTCITAVGVGEKKKKVEGDGGGGAAARMVVVGASADGKGVAGSGLVVGPNGLRLENSKEDVENLLTSKVSPELKEEVTDTLREVKLRHLLKKAAMKSQKQTKTGLQQEVEAALARSAKLLEKVTREDLPSTKAAVSDISDASFSTQALLAANGGSSDDSVLSFESVESKDRKNGHIYSYRHSPIRAAQLSSSLTSPSVRQRSRYGARRGSMDSLLPPHELTSSRAKISLSSSSNSLSNNSDPSDIIKRIRSRSVPSRLHKQRDQSLPLDWLSQLDHSVSRSVPSWVKNMSPSEISDSLWVPRGVPLQKSAIPSWVEDVDKSDISVDVSGFESLSGISMASPRPKPARPLTASLKTQKGNDVSYLASEPRADLSHSTLSPTQLSPTLNSSKHVTFGDHELLSRSPANPVHSTPISRDRRNDGQKYSIRTLSPSKVLDSEFNGEAYLRNSILPQTARLKRSMENFASSTEILRKSPSSSNSSDASSDHKCSSLDTFALLTGRTVPKIDAHHKLRKSGNAIFPDSPAISSILPEGSQGRLSNGHSSSDGLDGDRPWEAMTNTFKPPVPVGEGREANYLNNSTADAGALRNLSMSLSGGNQPGSMEALKNMLFKLQAEENCVQVDSAKTENSNGGQAPSSPAAIPALQGYNFQMEPGGHSLEKALLHLNRLKTLVKNTGVLVKSSPEESANERCGHDTGPSGSDENEKSS